MTLRVITPALGLLWAALAVATAGAADEQDKPATGTFAGTVVVDRAIPPRRPLVQLPNGVTVEDESLLVDPATKGLKNVVVYARTLPPGVAIPQAENEPAAFTSDGAAFAPHILVVRTGQPIEFKNLGADPASVHTSPFRNRGVNRLVKFGETSKLTYAEPEILPVNVTSDILPWMAAYHVVLDHPWAALTDSEGAFSISGLPPGDYEFTVWHERLGYVERKLPVGIQARETSKRTFEVPAAKLDRRSR